ncbi:NgoMIV family type II restriction endonuclease [Streptomyces sp. NPDC049916]|uniref:NgoMIV family type II restriction endonuclease n=1 Tax=Streptomyces sp. NPDC049916 TaxID=3155156 RepID=UPI00344A4D7C
MSDLGVPVWLPKLLAWKPATAKNMSRVTKTLGRENLPNIADGAQRASLSISGHMFQRLNIGDVVDRDADKANDESLGRLLEEQVATDLREKLTEECPHIAWDVQRNARIWDFAQYAHIKELRDVARKYPEVEALVGDDYLIDPDVTVGVLRPLGVSLRAAVSCKWTIRSDRAQNVRHEFNSMIKSRRGRAPHLIAVTAEPLPSRLSSLTQGMGEIDAVYHVAYGLIDEAVRDYTPLRGGSGEVSQLQHWERMTGQGRLRDYRDLFDDILAD